MSRAALELERAVKEMRAKSAKESRARGGITARRSEASVDQNEQTGNELTGDSKSVMTDTDLSQGAAAGGNDAAGAEEITAEGKPPVAKKNGNGAAKKAKTPKAPKAAKPAAAAKERKPRQRAVASGSLKKVEASGDTYLTLEFDEGKIVLTPTGNREQNRDIAVKALRGLLK